MEFKFVSNQKPGKVDVNTLCCQKLVGRIDQQIGIIQSVIEGHEPRRTWFGMDEAGTYFVSLEYGGHPPRTEEGNALRSISKPLRGRKSLVYVPRDGD